jgi:hypothetical protein
VQQLSPVIPGSAALSSLRSSNNENVKYNYFAFNDYQTYQEFDHILTNFEI